MKLLQFIILSLFFTSYVRCHDLHDGWDFERVSADLELQEIQDSVYIWTNKQKNESFLVKVEPTMHDAIKEYIADLIYHNVLTHLFPQRYDEYKLFSTEIYHDGIEIRYFETFLHDLKDIDTLESDDMTHSECVIWYRQLIIIVYLDFVLINGDRYPFPSMNIKTNRLYYYKRPDNLKLQRDPTNGKINIVPIDNTVGGTCFFGDDDDAKQVGKYQTKYQFTVVKSTSDDEENEEIEVEQNENADYANLRQLIKFWLNFNKNSLLNECNLNDDQIVELMYLYLEQKLPIINSKIDEIFTDTLPAGLDEEEIVTPYQDLLHFYRTLIQPMIEDVKRNNFVEQRELEISKDGQSEIPQTEAGPKTFADRLYINIMEDLFKMDFNVGSTLLSTQAVTIWYFRNNVPLKLTKRESINIAHQIAVIVWLDYVCGNKHRFTNLDASSDEIVVIINKEDKIAMVPKINVIGKFKIDKKVKNIEQFFSKWSAQYFDSVFPTNYAIPKEILFKRMARFVRNMNSVISNLLNKGVQQERKSLTAKKYQQLSQILTNYGNEVSRLGLTN